jgi:hypothetical protein
MTVHWHYTDRKSKVQRRKNPATMMMTGLEGSTIALRSVMPHQIDNSNNSKNDGRDDPGRAQLETHQ